MENLVNKLQNYYKKTKTMGVMVANCKDIHKILNLYEYYFQLLDKMNFYNRKIMNYILDKNNTSWSHERIEEYTKSHKNLEYEILKWRTDADGKYKEILDWYKGKKELENKKSIIENQVSKLKLLYNESDMEFEKTIMERMNKLDQYIIYKINGIIDFLLVINESINNISAISSLYRISKIIKNIGIKTVDEKQIYFNEVYTSIKNIVTENDTIMQKLDDVHENIKKRNDLSDIYHRKINGKDDSIIEYINKLNVMKIMIENNNKILETIDQKLTTHIESSKFIC